MNPLRSTRAFPLVIIGLALVLRVALAINGGQYFHFDEARHERGIWIYIGLLHGYSVPLRTVATMPEHTLFPWVGAAVTKTWRKPLPGCTSGTWSGRWWKAGRSTDWSWTRSPPGARSRNTAPERARCRRCPDTRDPWGLFFSYWVRRGG